MKIQSLLSDGKQKHELDLGYASVMLQENMLIG